MLAQLMHMIGPVACNKAALGVQQANDYHVCSMPKSTTCHCSQRQSNLRTGDMQGQQQHHIDPAASHPVASMRIPAHLLSCQLLQKCLVEAGRKASPRPRPQSVEHVEDISFTSVPPEALPDVVRESEAEWRRCGAWQPCLPVRHAPKRYAHLYECPRWDDLLIWKWLQHQAKVSPASIPAAPLPLGAESLAGCGHSPPPLDVCSGADQQPGKALSNSLCAIVRRNRVREPSGQGRQTGLKGTDARKRFQA